MADGLLTQPLRDFGRGYNREAVAGLLGAPVDMTTQLINLLIAGGGYAAHKAGLVNQPPELIDPARAVGSSDWIYQRLPAQPALTGSKSEQAGRLAGALLSPPAVMQAAPKVTRTLAQALREKVPSVVEDYMGKGGMLARVTDASDNMFDVTGLPNRGAEFLQSKANDLAKQLRDAGFEATVSHSGSVAGPSSYVNVFDPDTGRFLKNAVRFSGHSKGVKESAGVWDMSSQADVDAVMAAAIDMRNMGPADNWKKLKAIEDAATEAVAMKNHNRLKRIEEKLQSGIELSNSEKKDLVRLKK